MAPRGRRVMAAMVGTLLAVVACGTPSPSPSTLPSDVAPSPSRVASPAPSTASRPLASGGSIASLASDGSLSIIDADGRSTLLADIDAGRYGFPTWSPDGSRLAVIRYAGARTAVVVFDTASGTSTTVDPTVIFDRDETSPFYLYWAPDGRSVSFLATEADVLSLRVAPADGSAPIDGTGAGSIVRSGNPFYYDWLADDRLFAHIGAGADGFLGEIGLDGAEARPGLDSPGDFRSGVVSADHTFVAFVRGAVGGPGEVVVSGRDGSNEHAMPVFGQTALQFGPTGASVAAIGPHEPGESAGFPLGPLRLLEAASGEVRTLIDGFVVSFWWSPDGKTIAALRVQPTIAEAAPSGQPAGEPATEVRLIFVDVATGRTLSQPIVRPAERFVSGILAYFDQYALSHRVWAPDSSSILLPEVGTDGETRLTVHFPDGGEPITLDGVIGFWTP